MSIIRTFRALRPKEPFASRIAAVPYDVVSTAEARTRAEGNELSFLHVSRAEIDLPDSTDPYSAPVYQTAAQRFTALREHLIQEEEPSVYVYRLRMGMHEQIGAAACYSLDEYDRGMIKKHERTRRDKEDDRTRHMIELGAQTGPVFLTYRASRDVDAIVNRVTSTAPLYDFVADDEVAHTIWRADRAQTKALVDAFGALPALYIADGHHRAASAARARAERGGRHAGDEVNWMLAVAFPDNQVQILPYNRAVTDLGGLTVQAFLEALRSTFEVRPGTPAPERRGDVSMYLGGAWHTIVVAPEQRSGGDVISNLDVSILQDRVLAPLLKIADVRTDKRIEFIGGIRGTSELEQLVSSGAAAVAFSMFPVSVDDLMGIADAGGIMPPKSTWFEPKLRDGLLIHSI